MWLSALNGTFVRLGQGPAYALGADTSARAECAAAGGVFSVRPMNYVPGTAQIAPAYDEYFCMIPERAAASPSAAAPVITVSVPTTVSPQVSPSFVQQDEPSNSPVGTNAEQGGNFTELLKALAARQEQPAAQVIQVPAYMPVPSTTDAIDAQESVTLPTPFGPSSIPIDTFQRYAPWVAGFIIVGALWYSKRRK